MGGVIPLDVDYRESHLERPGVHDLLDSHILGQSLVPVSLLSQVAPEVILLSRLVRAKKEGK